MSRDSAFIPIPKSTSMFVQMAEAIWQAPVTAMSSPSWGAPVVSYQEVPYALRSMFSSLASMISFAGPMGMVPNLPMCLKGSLEGAQNVVDTISSYPRLSQCANVGLQQQVRVQSSHLTTMGIFSSIHINFLLLTVTWIYMSYTLLKMVDHWAEYKDNSFKYGIIINYAIYAWNIIFSIICVVFLLVPDTQNIPPNNLLIGAVGTMVAFLHQYFVISGNDANGDRLTDQRSQIKASCPL